MVGGARLSSPPRRREISTQRGGPTSWSCDLGQIPFRQALVWLRVNGSDSNCPSGLWGGLDEGKASAECLAGKTQIASAAAVNGDSWGSRESYPEFN